MANIFKTLEEKGILAFWIATTDTTYYIKNKEGTILEYTPPDHKTELGREWLLKTAIEEFPDKFPDALNPKEPKV